MEDVDLRLLGALDALLQAGSVGGAARQVGLSTPAMSHALARLRRQLGDPILVRAGRGMARTPRAEALAERVRALVSEARAVLAPARPFAPRELVRTFTVHATDYVLTLLGPAVDRRVRAEAPGVALRFAPNAADDPARLRDGDAALAVGIYGALPAEMRSRVLLTDRFVCVVRRGHPALAGKLTLDQFLALAHIQVAPRGRPGGYVDDELRARGRARTVARAVPYFVTALQLAAETDYVLTISERVARRYAAGLGLEVVEAPLRLRPYALSLVWHPRVDGDPGHRFLREAFAAAAREVAGDRHDQPRTRLDATDPTSGEGRRRPRRPRADRA